MKINGLMEGSDHGFVCLESLAEKAGKILFSKMSVMSKWRVSGGEIDGFSRNHVMGQVSNFRFD